MGACARVANTHRSGCQCSNLICARQLPDRGRGGKRCSLTAARAWDPTRSVARRAFHSTPRNHYTRSSIPKNCRQSRVRQSRRVPSVSRSRRTPAVTQNSSAGRRSPGKWVEPPRRIAPRIETEQSAINNFRLPSRERDDVGADAIKEHIGRFGGRYVGLCDSFVEIEVKVEIGWAFSVEEVVVFWIFCDWAQAFRS